MRKILLLLGLVTFLIGCEKTYKTVPPSAQVAVENTTASTISLVIKTKHAEAASYLCLPSSQSAPTPAEVWQNGVALNSNSLSEQSVDIEGLTAGTDYTIYVVAKNKVLVVEAQAEASTTFEYNIDAELSYSQGWYYGDFYKDGSGYYLIALSDKPLTGRGMPSTAPQKIIHLMLGAKKTDNSNAAVLPSGKYQLSDGQGLYTVDGYNSRYMEGFSVNTDGTVNGGQVKLMEGKTTVEYKDGKYTIVSDFTTSDEGDYKYVKLNFKGNIEFENEDPDSYLPISGTFEIEPTGLGGYAYSSAEYLSSSFGQCNITLWNTPIDDYGFVIGAGEIVSLFFIPPYSRELSADWFAGNYPIKPYYPYNAWVVNTAIGGIWYDTEYSGYAAGGTYYNTYDSNGQPTRHVGLAKDGNINITASGNDITVKFEFTTEEGATVKGEYTAPYTNIYDYNPYYPEAPVAGMQLFTTGKVNIRNLCSPKQSVFLK